MNFQISKQKLKLLRIDEKLFSLLYPFNASVVLTTVNCIVRIVLIKKFCFITVKSALPLPLNKVFD